MVEREKVVERVVERVRDRVLPTASHPALIVCASPVPGASTTTLAAALAGWLFRRGLDALLVGVRRQYAERQGPQGEAPGRYRAGVEALADGRRMPRSVTMARHTTGTSTESACGGRSTSLRPRLSEEALAILERMRLPGEALGATPRRALREAERSTAILQSLARLEVAVATMAAPVPGPTALGAASVPPAGTPQAGAAGAAAAKVQRLLATTDEDRWG